MSIVSLVFRAVDNASRIVGGIGRALGDLNSRLGATESASGGAESGIEGLVGQIRSGVLQANLLTGAFGQVMNAGRSAFSSLTGSLQQAQGIQLQNIQAASTFASLTGQSYSQAAQFVDSFNARIAKSAAALPGETEQYAMLARTINDSLIPAFQDANGKLDQTKFEDSLASITESYTALSAAGNIDLGNTSLGLTQALGGASVASLRQLQIFQNNPVLLNAIEAGLKEAGAKSLADLDIGKRVAIIQAAGQKLITEDFKEQSTKSADGLIQSFKSSVLDPSTGVLGVMRDLDSKKAGVQSAFASFNETLIQLIGPEGLFFSFSATLDKLGLTFDPMQLLKNGLDRFNQFLTVVNTQVDAINKALDQGRSLSDLLPSALDSVFTGISNALGLNSGTFNLNASQIGAWTADLVDSVLAFLGDRLTSLLVTADLSGVGNIAGIVANAVGDFISAFLTNLDSGSYLTLATGLAAAALIPPLIGAISTFAASLSAIFVAGTAGLPVLLVVAAGVALGALAKAIIDNWDQVVIGVGQFFSPIADYFRGSVDLLVGAITGDFDKVGAAVKRISAAIIQGFENIYDNYAIATGQKTAGEQRASATMDLAEQRFQAAQNAGTLSRFNGQIPNAANGLFAAAQRESAAMPSGAQIVVANNSEYILKPTGRGAPGGSVVNIAPGAIVIQGVSDARQAAQEAVRLLQAMIQQEMSGQLG